MEGQDERKKETEKGLCRGVNFATSGNTYFSYSLGYGTPRSYRHTRESRGERGVRRAAAATVRRVERRCTSRHADASRPRPFVNRISKKSLISSVFSSHRDPCNPQCRGPEIVFSHERCKCVYVYMCVYVYTLCIFIIVLSLRLCELGYEPALSGAVLCFSGLALRSLIRSPRGGRIALAARAPMTDRIALSSFDSPTFRRDTSSPVDSRTKTKERARNAASKIRDRVRKWRRKVRRDGGNCVGFGRHVRAHS